MIRTSLIVVVGCAIGACATVDMSNQPQRPAMARPQGLPVQQVIDGFVQAVIEGCAPAAEAGQSLQQLASPSIVPDPDRPALMQPKAGKTGWAPVLGKGIVMIDDGDGSCEVSTYGLPVEATFTTLSVQLAGKGYESHAVPPQDPKYFAAHLEKKVGERTVVVHMSGNEPGAAGMVSRFSTLTAQVTVK
jgi:hypothetical protein